MAQDNSGNVVWFILGAAVGAGVALLYAPQSGEDTRRFIGKKTREGRESLSDMGDDIVDKSRDLLDKGRKVADDAAGYFERTRRSMES